MDDDTVMDTGDNEGVDKHQDTKDKKPQNLRSHEITTKTLKSSPFAYVSLELITDKAGSAAPETDLLTVRSHITSALKQFLGLTGLAISIDILKLEKEVCWIRVPREDLSPVLAAIGGWVSSPEEGGSVSWKIRGSGNWLGAIVGREDVDELWR